LGQVMGGLYVRFQVRDYGFCRSWVSKDREDVGRVDSFASRETSR
jgi:hypothetical protein